MFSNMPRGFFSDLKYCLSVFSKGLYLTQTLYNSLYYKENHVHINIFY